MYNPKTTLTPGLFEQYTIENFWHVATFLDHYSWPAKHRNIYAHIWYYVQININLLKQTHAAEFSLGISVKQSDT